MSAPLDWIAIARLNSFDIPEPALQAIAPALDGLLASFRPLLPQLEHETEPAVTLSEAAVTGR